MRFISCHNGQIFTSATQWAGPRRREMFGTGLEVLDGLLAEGGFERGAIHEVLSGPRQATPRFFAVLLARAALGRGEQRNDQREKGVVVWCDPLGTLYPPAVAAAGIPLEKLFLLHPANAADQTWAIAECLRCPGVAATVAPVSRLSRIEARRLQLAAETGGGAGILLRPLDRGASIYAAATRWRVSPLPGLRTVQKWKIQLIHAHGGRIGHTVILEHHRETNTVRAVDQLADRQAAETPERATA